MKRSYTMAQLSYPRSYVRAVVKRRKIQQQRSQTQIPRNLVGTARISGAYRRSVPGSVEKKYLDTAIAWTGDNSTGMVQSICLIAQGTTDQTRIGTKLIVRNINIRWWATLDSQTTGPNGQLVRLMVVQDLQANGAQAAVTDVLKSANQSAFRNLDNDERFKVLYDKWQTINPTAQNAATSSALNVSQLKKVNKKCYIPIVISSTTNDIANVKSNNIFVLGIATGAVSNISAQCRIKFTDA